MVGRNTNVAFKGRIKKRKTNRLQILKSDLQRTTGPYRWPGTQTFHSRAGYRSARPIASKSSNLTCNARPVHTVVPGANVRCSGSSAASAHRCNCVATSSATCAPKGFGYERELLAAGLLRTMNQQ